MFHLTLPELHVRIVPLSYRERIHIFKMAVLRRSFALVLNDEIVTSSIQTTNLTFVFALNWKLIVTIFLSTTNMRYGSNKVTNNKDIKRSQRLQKGNKKVKLRKSCESIRK